MDCGVIADKIPGRVWHPGCFTCTTCDEILVDLIYFQVTASHFVSRLLSNRISYLLTFSDQFNLIFVA